MDAEPRMRATGAPIAVDVAAEGSLAIEGEVDDGRGQEARLGRAGTGGVRMHGAPRY
jgi:hypothetical protein